MAKAVLVDNDIVIKVSAYGLSKEALTSTTLVGVPPAMLGVARFVVRDRLARGRWLADRARAEAAFDVLLAGISMLEPSEPEIAAAAEMEAAATRLGLEFDSGESQLLAIMILRGCPMLLTGDKRAVRAVERVASEDAKGRIGSLEQLVADIMRRMDPSVLRMLICAEPCADKALSICFGCSRSSAPAPLDIAAGLASYVGHLRREAPNVLVSSTDLAALTA